MSLLIKGMDMPKDCLLCPCCVSEGVGAGRQHYCQAIDDEPYVSENYRPKNCPLSEIPTPHGDLIDRDMVLCLGNVLLNDTVIHKWAVIKVPAIIEQEE